MHCIARVPLHTHSSMHAFIDPCIHSLVHPFIHPFLHPFIDLRIHSFIHESIYPFTHSLTNSVLLFIIIIIRGINCHSPTILCNILLASSMSSIPTAPVLWRGTSIRSPYHDTIKLHIPTKVSVLLPESSPILRALIHWIPLQLHSLQHEVYSSILQTVRLQKRLRVLSFHLPSRSSRRLLCGLVDLLHDVLYNFQILMIIRARGAIINVHINKIDQFFLRYLQV
mmetsp:Transcript_38688/g.46855  ORF Transcript_38688/g.46855 Transcript_38688/m.46855 type:complete len:225 (-) Transcript_38688:455-1129(-)